MKPYTRFLEIEGRKVGFMVTGGTGRLYSRYFGKNWLNAMSQFLDEKGNLNSDNLSTDFFEEIAWVMAKQADPSIPEIEEWLEETFSTPMAFMENLEGIMNIFIKGSTPTTYNPGQQKKRKAQQKP